MNIGAVPEVWRRSPMFQHNTEGFHILALPMIIYAPTCPLLTHYACYSVKYTFRTVYVVIVYAHTKLFSSSLQNTIHANQWCDFTEIIFTNQVTDNMIYLLRASCFSSLSRKTFFTSQIDHILDGEVLDVISITYLRIIFLMVSILSKTLSSPPSPLLFVLLSGPRISFQWRHNDHDGVSNHQPHGCLLKRLYMRWSKKTSKLRVTGLCEGNSPGDRWIPRTKGQ